MPESRRLFRIVQRDPPSTSDFRSHEELGRELLDPAKIEMWRGVSVYGTLHQARKKAKQYPSLGTFIAELLIPDGGAISVTRTGGASHYTIDGPRELMLESVIALHRVEGEEHGSNV